MEMKRVLIASIIGTVLAWYDFLIYATASALVFTKLFFPSSNPGLSAIASFGTLGVGYLARPLGAAIFGHFGDRFGRKPMLATTIVIMGLGTFLMGLLPLTSRSGSQRRSSWSCCGCFSVWDSWANGAALCGSWSRTRRARIAGFSVRLSARHPFCSRHLRAPFSCAGSGLPRMGMAHSVPDQHLSRGSRTLHPSATAGDAGVSRTASLE
jgi:MFS family permease